MTAKATQDLAALFQAKLRDARRTGQMQKLGLTGGVMLRVQVERRRVSLLVCRPEYELGLEDLALVRGQCGVPRHATRVPLVGQHEQQIADRRYFAIEYSWLIL